MVGPDLHALNLVLVDAAGKDIAGLTDVDVPRRHSPKRATKVRKLLGLPLKNSKEGTKLLLAAHKSAFSREIILKNGKTV